MSANGETARGEDHAPAGAVHRTRPFYWSVRRELWENRAVTRAPLAAAAVVLLGFLVNAIRLPGRLAALAADPAGGASALDRPYEFTSILVLGLAVIVGVFYCLEALHGERRDRSILFWKSLPVSDTVAVLAKAAVPLLVLPSITFATVLGIQFVMLLVSIAVAVLHGVPVGLLLGAVPLVPMSIELLYGLVTLALWHAPVYAWLLLVSAWARRTPFLWAVLPPMALCVLERVAFGSWHVAAALVQRLTGSFALAFDFGDQPGGSADQLARLEPGRFLGSPSLWIGLVICAALLAATIRLRRDRGPI